MKKLLSLLLCFLLVSTLVVNVSASKASMITLKPNKIYKNYDITGDKKKDQIKITRKKFGDMYENITISINGKKSVIKPSYSYYSSTIKLIHLSNGKAFLWIKGSSDNDDDPFETLYQYKKGKMVKVLDFRSVNQKYGYHTGTTITKVSGKTIYTKQYLMSASLGLIYFNYNYQYKKGKFVRTSSIANITNGGYTYRTNSKFGTMKKTRTIYTSPTSQKKKGTIKKGTKVQPTKIYMTNSKIFIQLKTKSRKIGWVKGSKTINDDNLILKECFYAG